MCGRCRWAEGHRGDLTHTPRSPASAAGNPNPKRHLEVVSGDGQGPVGSPPPATSPKTQLERSSSHRAQPEHRKPWPTLLKLIGCCFDRLTRRVVLFLSAPALSLQSSSMEDPESLGFEHMGLDHRLLQVPGRLRSRTDGGWERWQAARRLSRPLSSPRPSPIWAGRDPR